MTVLFSFVPFKLYFHYAIITRCIVIKTISVYPQNYESKTFMIIKNMPLGIGVEGGGGFNKKLWENGRIYICQNDIYIYYTNKEFKIKQPVWHLILQNNHFYTFTNNEE